MFFAKEYSLEECKDLAKSVVGKIPGWCNAKKAEAMMDLVFEVKPNTCVELGVYNGASLFPTALALKHLKFGIVYAIDAWDSQEAVRYYPKEGPHRGWWEGQDLNKHYRSCLSVIGEYGLGPYCVVLRQTFANALEQVPCIDILHIDATHTNEGDFIDVVPYARKVKKDGYIWFDGWANSNDTYEHLKKTCLVEKVINSGTCILLHKIIEE